MSKSRGLFKSFFQLLLPVFILMIMAVVGASVFFIHQAAHPKADTYLVTPERYGQLSTRGALITEESWANHDGGQSQGWVLRGTEGGPAVILLHRYGTDRSHVLDLGVKINESTNFTILMPDFRGHGPSGGFTSFGGCETKDTLAAIEFLKNLKAENQNNLVGPNIGIYGVELGALTALSVASKDQNVKALVLDSVPSDSDQILGAAVERRFPLAISVTSKIAAYGTYLYFYDGCYQRDSSCDNAKTLENRHILLLAGSDVPVLQDMTTKLSRCITGQSVVETKTDFNPSGYNLTNATIEQRTIYDQKVIEFFSRTLRN